MNNPNTRNTPTDDKQLQDLLELEPVPFDAKRIKQRVFGRLDDAATTAQSSPQRRQARSQRQPRRRLSRRLTVALVAAAVMIIGIPSAFAVSDLIANMSEGGIGFFNTTGAADKDVNKPTYYVSMQADLEKLNAPVGQTLTFDGGTITLDTLAVDDNFLNAFFTIRYDEPINTEGIGNGLAMPEWFGLLALAPPDIICLVDGEEITGRTNVSSGGDFENDPYYIDERTIGVMMHKVIIKDLPDVFDLSISVFGDEIVVADSATLRGAHIDDSFEMTVDKSASAALTRSIEPGDYRFEGALGTREIKLERISFSPFGVIAVIQAENIDDIAPLVVVDDLGNTALFQFRNGVANWPTDPQYDGTLQNYVFELVGLDPQAQSVTITPIAYETAQEDSYEFRLVDLSQVGAQIALNNLGGVTVVSHEIEQGAVTIKLKPYGYLQSTGPEFVLQDDQLLSHGETLDGVPRMGIKTSWYDRGEGLIVLTTDYYAATDEELAQATTDSYAYTKGLFVNESAALTLPLG
jgi:hypothetical protein